MKIRFPEAPSLNIRNGNLVTSGRWRAQFESLGHRVKSCLEHCDGQCDLLVVFRYRY
ncbi:MAG TPA: hypothetical protein PLI53_09600 [Geobacteraceae bacterium]|nr:hypothetical protein [Geobacteraceae bacterium]